MLQKKHEKHNLNWPQIPDDPYRILIIGGSGSGKTNSLISLIIQQPDIDKNYLCAKDQYEAQKFNDSKAFNEYSNDMDDINKNMEEYNSNKKRK